MSSSLMTLNERGSALSARNALFEQHQPFVESIVNCLLRRRRHVPGFERSDLVQEGCIGLIRAVDTFDSARNNNFLAWARSCIVSAVREATRGALDEKRLVDSLDEYSREQIADAAPPPHDAVDARLFLAGALDQLPGRQREAIERHYFLDQNKTEVARRMSITPQRAGQLLEDGLQNLRRFAESS